ncbi:ATP-binding cassette domain-containing protein [soil metagenome]
MRIELEQLMPEPLIEIAPKHSDVWQQTLQLTEGQWTQLVAPSGRGKSTLLNIIYGNRADYRGEVKIDGKSTRTFTANDWATLRRERLSVIFQDLRLFADLSGWDNLMLKQQLTHTTTKDEIADMAMQLGVLRLLDKTCGTMSFGERQRVAIIRSLLQPFQYLLLDEPFSHLDENNRQIAADLIRQACETRKAGLLIAGLGADRYFTYHQSLQLDEANG